MYAGQAGTLGMQAMGFSILGHVSSYKVHIYSASTRRLDFSLFYGKVKPLKLEELEKKDTALENDNDKRFTFLEL